MRPPFALVALTLLDLLVLFAPGIDGVVRLVLHLGLTLVGLAMAVRRGRFGMASAALGLVGPIGVLIGHAVAWRRRLRLPAPSDATEPTVMESAATGARMLDGRMQHAPSATLGSLVTVLRHGNVSARRRALETVVRSFEPSLSPLIARALADGDQTIRALAAAAAARVSRNLAQRRTTLAARIGHGDAAAEEALLKALTDHARSNVLLSDAQRDHLRRDALALLGERPSGETRNRQLESVMAEAAWAAGDYELIDGLAARHRGDGDDTLGWWRTEARA